MNLQDLGHPNLVSNTKQRSLNSYNFWHQNVSFKLGKKSSNCHVIDQAGNFSFTASGNELIYAPSFIPAWSFTTLEWVLRIRIFSSNLFTARAKENSSTRPKGFKKVRDQK